MLFWRVMKGRPLFDEMLSKWDRLAHIAIVTVGTRLADKKHFFHHEVCNLAAAQLDDALEVDIARSRADDVWPQHVCPRGSSVDGYKPRHVFTHAQANAAGVPHSKLKGIVELQLVREYVTVGGNAGEMNL